jgi:hypothetical protein
MQLLEGFTPDGSSALPFGIDFAAEHGVQLRSSEQDYRNVDRAVVCHIMDLTHIYTAFPLLEYPELWRGPVSQCLHSHMTYARLGSL